MLTHTSWPSFIGVKAVRGRQLTPTGYAILTRRCALRCPEMTDLVLSLLQDCRAIAHPRVRRWRKTKGFAVCGFFRSHSLVPPRQSLCLWWLMAKFVKDDLSCRNFRSCSCHSCSRCTDEPSWVCSWEGSDLRGMLAQWVRIFVTMLVHHVGPNLLTT